MHRGTNVIESFSVPGAHVRKLKECETALSKGDGDVVLELLSRNPELTRIGFAAPFEIFHRSVSADRDRIIKWYYDNNILQMNDNDDIWWPYIFFAIECNTIHVLQSMIENGAFIYAKHPITGTNCLERAIEQGSREAARILHEAGATASSYPDWLTPLNSDCPQWPRHEIFSSANR